MALVDIPRFLGETINGSVRASVLRTAKIAIPLKDHILGRTITEKLARLQTTGACQFCDLRNVDLSGLDLHDTDLRRTDLSGANLTGADLTGADLDRANLTGADLIRADLRGTDLGADLTGADLTGANLGRAYLARSDLRGADLTGASLTRIILVDTYLKGATIELRQFAKVYRCSKEIPDREENLWIKTVQKIYELYGKREECKSKWGKSGHEF